MIITILCHIGAHVCLKLYIVIITKSCVFDKQKSETELMCELKSGLCKTQVMYRSYIFLGFSLQGIFKQVCSILNNEKNIFLLC